MTVLSAFPKQFWADTPLSPSPHPMHAPPSQTVLAHLVPMSPLTPFSLYTPLDILDASTVVISLTLGITGLYNVAFHLLMMIIIIQTNEKKNTDNLKSQKAIED